MDERMLDLKRKNDLIKERLRQNQFNQANVKKRPTMLESNEPEIMDIN